LDFEKKRGFRKKNRDEKMISLCSPGNARIDVGDTTKGENKTIAPSTSKGKEWERMGENVPRVQKPQQPLEL